LVMDACECDVERAKSLYDLLVKTFDDHAGMPVRHCIGNHDIFGWSKQHKAPLDHPQYGKKMFCERLNLPRTYYAFDFMGWRFFVLDDIQPFTDDSYQGCIDGEQMAWFLKELENKPSDMPAVVICHIPIFSSTVFVDSPEGESYNIPVSLMCRDSRILADLFAKNNIKLALSGHSHEVDAVDFRGVKFICDGSVCGAWWTGPQNGFKEGFGVFDVFTDGSFSSNYCSYGWTV
jgi:3',5'-cyclic-AMP phosphodiesterase